jgi:ribonucleotide monophosphatase NagD (HAD superfamily)
LIAVHKARYFADKDEKLSMGPGGFVEGIITLARNRRVLNCICYVLALEFASGKKASVVGKPTANFFKLALKQM